jgi:nitric oxide reductase NorQ protein
MLIMPEKKMFYLSAANKALIDSIMKIRKNHPVNILINGKHGVGKSTLAEQIAATYKGLYTTIPIGILQESGQLSGRTELEDSKTVYKKAEFVEAIQTPFSFIHLEELNRPESPKALNELFPVLDDSRMLKNDKLGTIKVAPGVVFIGTLNEGFEYTGIDPLDEALRDRFFRLEIGYLPEAQETTLIMMRSGLIGNSLTALVKFINKLRNDAREPIHISTRRAIMIGELMAGGISMKAALISCVAMDKAKLEDILLHFDFAGTAPTGISGKEDNAYVAL